jgi:hypothetical protein
VLYIKLCNLNELECSWVDLGVLVMIDYAVVSAVLGALTSLVTDQLRMLLPTVGVE